MKTTLSIVAALLLSVASAATAQSLSPEDAGGDAAAKDAPAANEAKAPEPAATPPATSTPAAAQSEAGAALGRAIAALPPETSDEERNERAAVVTHCALNKRGN